MKDNLIFKEYWLIHKEGSWNSKQNRYLVKPVGFWMIPSDLSLLLNWRGNGSSFLASGTSVKNLRPIWKVILIPFLVSEIHCICRNILQIKIRLQAHP